MTRRTFVLLAATGSLALLAGAFLFQFAGYAPCEMCLWQRWPHAAAVVFGVIALGYTRPPLWPALGGALSMLISTGLAVWHSGVERAWWPGPSACTGKGITGDLLSTEGSAIVMCDQVQLYIFGLSMANWNAIASVVLLLIWLRGLQR